MKAFIKQFEKDKPDRPNYWAILNKACDMVGHEKQHFKRNLFLCPLQGLKQQLRHDSLKHLRSGIQIRSGIQKPYPQLEKILSNSLTTRLEKDTPKDDGESQKNINLGSNAKLIIL